MKKRIVGLLLSAVMLCSLLPVSAFAADSELNCSISLGLADGYSAYNDQFAAFNQEHKTEIKIIKPTVSTSGGDTIISWTVPQLKGWEVTGAEISIMDNTGDRVKEDGTSRGFLEDGSTYAPYAMPYDLIGNTITLTYTGDFTKITDVGEESEISGKIILKILIAPVEKKTTAPVTYSYVNQSEERVSSETAEWQRIANPERNPKQTEVLLGEAWIIPLNDSIELPYSGNPYESWKLTGCVVTINGTATEDGFIPVEDLQAGKSVSIPDDATSVNVDYSWMISGVTNIIESVDHVVKQNKQTLEPREESTPDTYIVNGKENVVVDYTATMDMRKLDSKFGADSWAWLNQRHDWITDKTTVLLHFTFDPNLDVAEANWADAELKSDMFVLAGGNFYNVSGQEVTVTCKWDGAKADKALEGKQELDNIITFTGVTIPVKSVWEGDTVEIMSSGYVDGTVHATIVYGDGTKYRDQGGIYGGYKSDTFQLTTKVTLSYDANSGTGSMDSQTYTVGDTATVAANGFTRSGYSFTGWNTEADGTGTAYQSNDTFAMPANDVTLYAQWSKNHSGGGGGSTNPPVLNTVDHYSYIVGYPDGTVRPEGTITRGEVATIFFRLLTDESRNEYWSQTSSYADVELDDWFNNAVCTLSNAGIINGYDDGTFRPNGNITRAEFAAIASRFFEYADASGENPFSDVSEGAWYYQFVLAASDMGLITGYPDGTFGPQKSITRAEAVTIVNRTLDRHPDEDYFLDDMVTWPDNQEGTWYYEDVQEATNSHEYVMNTGKDGKYEAWKKILPSRDWVAYEKAWSDANSASGGEVMR